MFRMQTNYKGFFDQWLSFYLFIYVVSLGFNPLTLQSQTYVFD